MLACTFVMAFGSYLVTPFLAVFLVKAVGFRVASAGAVVAVATFVQFAGSLPGGLAAERFGYKRTMVGALALRTCGLAGLALSPRAPAIAIPAVLLVAAGPALYLPANQAYVISSVPADRVPVFLSVSNAALSAGLALGPLLAVAFIERRPADLFLGAAALFGAMAIVHQVSIRPLTHRRASAPSGRWTATGLRDMRRPVLFNVVTFYLFFFFQSFIGLYVTEVFGSRLLGWVLMTNSIVVLTLQPLFAKQISQVAYRATVACSFSTMAGGATLMAVGSVPAMLAGTAVFSLGEVTLFLRGALEMVALTPADPAVAFGFQRLTIGVGGFLSGIVGAVLFERCIEAASPGAFWLLVAAQAAMAALLGLLLGEGRRSRRTRRGPATTDRLPSRRSVIA